MRAKEYEIETLADFAKVPVDRLPQCLSEFAGWIALIRDAAEIESLLGDITGVPSKFNARKFTWVDDGKPGLSAVNVTVKGTGEHIGRIEL